MSELPAALPSDPVLTLLDEGSGAPVLLLHGGGGPFTVAAIAAHLAPRMRVLTPTHPGWNGTPRPDWLTGVDDLAMLYLRLLRKLGLRDVTVIGSSMGGWIAAEMAVRDNGGIVGRVVLINAVGIDVPGQPITDFFGLDARGVADHSYHDPDRFYIDPVNLPPERVALQKANMATMRVFAQSPYMHDPKLRRRLGDVGTPALVIWGESDGIATLEYGRAYAAAFANGRFEVIREAGHLPHFEQPAATFSAIGRFLSETG